MSNALLIAALSALRLSYKFIELSFERGQRSGVEDYRSETRGEPSGGKLLLFPAIILGWNCLMPPPRRGRGEGWGGVGGEALTT